MGKRSCYDRYSRKCCDTEVRNRTTSKVGIVATNIYSMELERHYHIKESPH